MRIGVIELLVDEPLRGYLARLYGRYFRRQFVSIAPQAVSCWCRQLGHEVTYASYWGQGDPKRLLPDSLDVVFIATHTPTSALAYALAKLFRREKTLTVIGGPHARAFPEDCIRFFDLAVIDCDKILIDDILHRRFDPPAVVSSHRPFPVLPGVEERRREIETAAFSGGKPLLTSLVPMLTSVGCPYSCNFCVDWNTRYLPLPKDHVLADLRYVSRCWPRVLVGYHDPNFAVRFDETMDMLENFPEGRRNGYIMESSLSILKPSKLHRLKTTNCVYVAPGIESWDDYSNKSGVGAKTGWEKLEQVARHVDLVSRCVPGVQANIMVGTDLDKGSEPIEITRAFIRRLPGVWPTINIPTPFGGTPLHEQYAAEGRILKAMPFAFYYNPYLAITPKHYDPLEYFGHLIDLHEEIGSSRMLARRALTRSRPAVRFVHGLRTFAARRELAEFRRIHRMLATDRQFRAFHEGRSEALPAFYHNRLDARLGRYGALLSREDRLPVLADVDRPAVLRQVKAS